MIPFSLFEQTSKFDLSDVIELKKHSNYIKIFQQIVHPENIIYVKKGEIKIEDLSPTTLVHDVDYAIYDITGMYSVIDYNKIPEINISINPEIEGIKYEKYGDTIDIQIDLKSRIPEVGKLIDKLAVDEIKKGFWLRLPTRFNELPNDEQDKISKIVDELLIQNAIDRIQDGAHKKISHDDLVKQYISKYPIFLDYIKRSPEEYLEKTWLTPEIGSDLDLIIKAKKMIF